MREAGEEGRREKYAVGEKGCVECGAGGVWLEWRLGRCVLRVCTVER